jgi:hypothetical protein
VQVIGAKGNGKTSHLLHWVGAGGPYAHIPPGGGTPFLPTQAPVVAWDEVDRVPVARLLAALRSARRAGALVLMGTHRDLSQIVRLTGLPLVTHDLAPRDATTIAAWAQLRIASASVGTRALRVPVEVNRALAASGADWRAIGDALHGWTSDKAATHG